AIGPTRKSSARTRWSIGSRQRSTRAPIRTSSSWRAPMRWRSTASRRQSSARSPAPRPAPMASSRRRSPTYRCTSASRPRRAYLSSRTSPRSGRPRCSASTSSAAPASRSCCIPCRHFARRTRPPRTSTGPSGATARRRRSSKPCRRVRSSTMRSATGTTRRSSTSSSPRANNERRQQAMTTSKKASAPAPADARKPKKSVALSGIEAGNTALCTVGRSGNDLHYRGYDILDFAQKAEFEEIAHLLVHGKLPNKAELAAYKRKLKALRGLPEAVQAALECLPASAHPMDVMRTGVSVLGCVLPEKDDHNTPGARDIADRLMASLGSMLLYWYHYSHNGRQIDVETDDDSIGGHFLHLLHGEPPSESWIRAMHTSLILYAEHEFNASTFTGRVIAGTGSDMYSAVTGAIGALRG